MVYKILLVDDDKEITETLMPRLTREGYDVVVAYDGEEALTKVKADNPDIIILDLMMPKMNGFEVLKEIRTNHNDRWRPVIIISASVDLTSVKKGYDMEADHYLTKPCTLDNLLRGIRTMISLIPAHL
ncbi:MAG: response regulator [Candidatus Omnitrophica bacterium]|nr:response regulator [Candidatus Omnitrophota bacterium]